MSVVRTHAHQLDTVKIKQKNRKCNQATSYVKFPSMNTYCSEKLWPKNVTMLGLPLQLLGWGPVKQKGEELLDFAEHTVLLYQTRASGKKESTLLSSDKS